MTFSHPHRARQLIDFAGMKFGEKQATDMDAIIEWSNKAYILIEVKTKGAKLSAGQRIAFERLCDDLQKIKPTIVLVCTHENPLDQDIDLASCTVTDYRWRGEWKTLDGGQRVRATVERFLHKLGLLQERNTA